MEAKSDAAGGEEISLSIEETNKLRLSLGLKPLQIGASADEQNAHENYAQHKQKLQKEREDRQLKDRLDKAKRKRLREAKLEGKTLGEEDSDEERDENGNQMDDTEAWVEQSRRRQAEIQKKLEQERKEAAAQAKRDAERQYSAQDLTGLVVAHDIEQLEGENILVLQDTSVLADDTEQDALISVNVSEKEKRLREKESRRVKSAYEMMEQGEDSLLSKYDEEILGPKRKTFTLTGANMNVDQVVKEGAASARRQPNRPTVSLDFDNMQSINDYATPEEDVSFKKVKKKSKGKKKRTITTLDDEEVDAALTAGTNALPMHAKKINAETSRKPVENFVDDDDLQQALALSRKQTVKKKTAKVIAQELAEIEANADTDMQVAGSIVLSDTSEFVRNLSMVPTAAAVSKKTAEEKPSVSTSIVMASTSKDVVMMEQDNVEQSPTAPLTTTEEEKKLVEQITEEPLVGQGLAATLALLSQKGILQKPTKEQMEHDSQILRNQVWLKKRKEEEAKQQLEKSREQKWLAERGIRHARKDDDVRFDRLRTQEIEEKFKDYKPNIKLEYKDEFGRELSTKEAYRQLAHKFHGTAPGKNKREKEMKKRQQELQLLRMTSDAPSTMVQALQTVQQQTGSAHLVVSVGHRNAAPTKLNAVLPSSSGTSSVSGKKSNGGAEVQGTASVSLEAGSRPAMKPIGGTSVSAGSGFKPIPAAPSAAQDREKVQFGLGNKRKHEGDEV